MHTSTLMGSAANAWSVKPARTDRVKRMRIPVTFSRLACEPCPSACHANDHRDAAGKPAPAIESQISPVTPAHSRWHGHVLMPVGFRPADKHGHEYMPMPPIARWLTEGDTIN